MSDELKAKDDYHLKTLLERYDITAEGLTRIIDGNGSCRGMVEGYVAEEKLREIWFNRPEFSNQFKSRDHDRSNKGDLVVTYRGQDFKIEAKSLQTGSIRHRTPESPLTGRAQVDASDKRQIILPDGSRLTTTNLLVGEFDILAINLFHFQKKWNFVFARNSLLPRSTFAGYTPEQRAYLLATTVKVEWPLPPGTIFHSSPFALLDEICAERQFESDRIMGEPARGVLVAPVIEPKPARARKTSRSV